MPTKRNERSVFNVVENSRMQLIKEYSRLCRRLGIDIHSPDGIIRGVDGIRTVRDMHERQEILDECQKIRAVTDFVLGRIQQLTMPELNPSVRAVQQEMFLQRLDKAEEQFGTNIPPHAYSTLRRQPPDELD